jgi:histone deacetylase complex regulatory component SIN3
LIPGSKLYHGTPDLTKPFKTFLNHIWETQLSSIHRYFSALRTQHDRFQRLSGTGERHGQNSISRLPMFGEFLKKMRQQTRSEIVQIKASNNSRSSMSMRSPSLIDRVPLMRHASLHAHLTAC